MSYSNNGCRNESNDVDKLLRYWGVSNDPCIFTNIVGAGIDTEEKRNKLLCTITATFEKHRQNWETFFPDKPMELVIPVIPNKDHRRRVFSVYALTQASENEIVDASSSSPNTIPRSKDRVACMPVVDLVSTSSERLIESIESDRLDIKSPPSKAKAKCKLKATPDMVANPEEAVHDLSPKSSEIVGVIGKVNKEQVEEESDLSHLSSKELEILKQDMVASLDVIHDYLPKISETVAVTGTVIEQVKEISDLSCKDKSLLKLFDEGIHKYLCERARRSEETHQLLVSKKSIKGNGAAALFRDMATNWNVSTITFIVFHPLFLCGKHVLPILRELPSI